jgi:hypothetical protein
MLALCACKSPAPVPADAAAAGSAPSATATAPPGSLPTATGPFSPTETAPWADKLQGPATGDGVKFGIASCFTETKHCVQVPLGWRTDGRAEAMGDGKIMWAQSSNRHVCMAIDRGGSMWAELIRRDEAERKGLSAPVNVKLGPDALDSTLQATHFEMAAARPYPFNIMMWFACFGPEQGAAATVAQMPPEPGTLLVMKIAVKAGLTFNTWAFVSDGATPEEKRDLLATLRGIRKLPGKLATHP